MSDADAAGTNLDAVLDAGLAAAANDPLLEDRERGAAAARALGFPQRSQEAWRYTPLAFLKRASYQPYAADAGATVQRAEIEPMLLHGHDGPRIVFVNGRFAADLSRLDDLPGGLSIATLADSDGVPSAEPKRQTHPDSEYRNVFSALNAVLATDGVVIDVADGVQLDRSVEILHVAVGDSQPLIFSPRHRLTVGAGASIDVIERYVGIGDGTYFDNVRFDIAIAEHGTLTHQYLQHESASAQHLSDVSVQIDAGGSYHATLAALGGDWARCDLRVAFRGEGGKADLNGLLLARDGQLNDVHLDIDHAVPACTSTESFKSILDGSGRVVFDGRILVARDAQQTDAALSNHNLMLSRSAEVDTKPQLEIYADDVKCSHGTTVGELDQNMLFYLRSRGIPEAQATRMLCQGFANDVLEDFHDDALREQARLILDARLAKTAWHE